MNRRNKLTSSVVILLSVLLPGSVPAAEPLRIHMIGIGEYKPVESLTLFKKYLEERYWVQITTSFSLDSAAAYTRGKPLPDLNGLQSAEVMVLFARRMNLPEEQMALIRGHWEKGKPIEGTEKWINALRSSPGMGTTGCESARSRSPSTAEFSTARPTSASLMGCRPRRCTA